MSEWMGRQGLVPSFWQLLTKGPLANATKRRIRTMALSANITTATDRQSREQHVDVCATATYEPTRECDKATHSHIGVRCNLCTPATNGSSRECGAGHWLIMSLSPKNPLA